LPLFQLENIENALAQITRKILLFQEILKNTAVREAGQILMTHKIRLILLLSFHKKVGLKLVLHEKKVEFLEEFFFFIFTTILDLIKLHYG
jgi:hypothetical protein